MNKSHWIVLGFFGLVAIGSFLAWNRVLGGGSLDQLPDFVNLLLVFGGCPAAIMLVGAALYFQVRADLYRSLPSEEQPGLDGKWVALYMLILFGLLLFGCVIFQRIYCQPMWCG